MSMSEFFAQWEKIEPACRALLPGAAKKILSRREWDRVDLDDFHVFNINEDGVEFCANYNDACHCHPEMQSAFVTISWNEIEQKIAEIEIDKKILDVDGTLDI